jgi:hypothetical protein
MLGTTLVNSCRQLLERLRRMQEELHFNLWVPGSSPGRALGTVAQLVKHQTPFAGVVSPIFVAADPREHLQPFAGHRRSDLSAAVDHHR